MKLYTSPISPFGARVSIAARVKGIDIEHVRPVGGLKTPEYLAINPIGRLPVLVTDNGSMIPESVVTLNYLEDRFPTPSLRPADPEDCARMNLVIHIMDTYVMAPIIRTFPHLDPAKRDARLVEQEIERWKQGLAFVAHFMKLPLPAVAAGITLADCVLPTALHLSEALAPALGVTEDFIKPYGVLVAYYDRIRQHPVVGPALDTLTAAQAAPH